MTRQLSGMMISLLLICAGHAQVALAEPFTADHLVRLDRVGAPVLAPDGGLVAYTLRKTDMEADKGRLDIWLSSLDGSATRQLTTHVANDSAPAWSADGRHLYFLSSRDESSQIWRIAVAGGEAVQVTNLPVDVGTFRLTPAGDRLVFSAEVYPDCEDLDCTASRDAAAEESATTPGREARRRR